MKIILTESQIIRLLSRSVNEEIEYGDDKSKIPTEVINLNWFDLNFNVLSDDDKDLIKKLVDSNKFEWWFNRNMNMFLSKYPRVKKIIAKENGEMVGFFIWTTTSLKKEGVNDDATPIPVILSTAIRPDYRKKGLYENMFKKSDIYTSYLVHVSDILSPFEFWQKKGCRVIHNVDAYNKIMYCK